MFILNTTFVCDRKYVNIIENWLRNKYKEDVLRYDSSFMVRVSQVLSNEEPGVVSLACEHRHESLSVCAEWEKIIPSEVSELNMMLGEENSVLFFNTFLKIVF